MMSSGVNLVMTVIGFAVSIMFIVFVYTRLICARIQLNRTRSYTMPLSSSLSHGSHHHHLTTTNIRCRRERKKALEDLSGALKLSGKDCAVYKVNIGIQKNDIGQNVLHGINDQWESHKGNAFQRPMTN